MNIEIGGVPQSNPCYGCADRSPVCHTECRRYKTWTVICAAHRKAYKKMAREDYAPQADMIARSITIKGKAPILQQRKYRRKF